MGLRCGIGLAGFPFDDAAGFWRWIELCERHDVDSFWQSDRLVSRETAREWLRPQVEGEAGDWGLGVQVDTAETSIRFFHTGSGNGFQVRSPWGSGNGVAMVLKLSQALAPSLQKSSRW